jgi:hypothetical protein
LNPIYIYRPEILEALAAHGLCPSASTPPERLRNAVRDLYNYEIRRIRSALLSGAIARPDYAGHIIELRKRYWLLSIPTGMWTPSR